MEEGGTILKWYSFIYTFRKIHSLSWLISSSLIVQAKMYLQNKRFTNTNIATHGIAKLSLFIVHCFVFFLQTDLLPLEVGNSSKMIIFNSS